jgi:hypothetical protein
MAADWRSLERTELDFWAVEISSESSSPYSALVSVYGLTDVHPKVGADHVIAIFPLAHKLQT